MSAKAGRLQKAVIFCRSCNIELDRWPYICSHCSHNSPCRSIPLPDHFYSGWRNCSVGDTSVICCCCCCINRPVPMNIKNNNKYTVAGKSLVRPKRKQTDKRYKLNSIRDWLWLQCVLIFGSFHYLLIWIVFIWFNLDSTSRIQITLKRLRPAFLVLLACCWRLSLVKFLFGVDNVKRSIAFCISNFDHVF